MRLMPRVSSSTSLLSLLVLVSLGCAGRAGHADDATDASDASDASDAIDMADAPTEVVIDVAPDPDVAAILDLAETPADGSTEALVEEIEEPQLPPKPPVPPVGLFDCTYDITKLPGRVSPVPLTCPIDPTCRLPMVVGHRATGGDLGPLAPENSLAAIRAAIVSGLDGIELDVRETKDEKLVVFHNGDVDAILVGTGTVSDLTLAEILQMPFQMDKVISGGDFACERVATFEDALDLVKGRLFVDLDLKTGRMDLVVPIVRDKGMLDQVFFSSGDIAKLQEVRALEPKARLQVRPDTAEQLQAATEAFSPAPDIYELPEAPNDFTSVAPKTVHELGRKALANSFGLDLQAYFASDPKLLTDLYVGGLDMLQSDMPTQVVKALGRWPF